MTGGLALLLALAAPSGISLVTPTGSGAVSLAVIVVPPGGTFLNFLEFPPSADRPEGQTDALVEHRRVFMGRVLAGPRISGRITIRQVYPETAAMFRIPVRRLAILERTDGGYWHVQWQARIERGRACLAQDAITHFRIVVPGRTPDRNGNICFSL